MKRKLLCLCALILALTMFLFPASAYGSVLNPWTETEETVTYTRVEESGYDLATTFPTYDNGDAYIRSACAPVAGANMVAFYDRDYPDMIPDYQGHYLENGNYRYVSDFYIEPVINDLAARMGTDDEGTTYVGFKRGLAAYISAAGYGLGFRDVVAAGNFYYQDFTNYIQAGYPVALFLSKMNTIEWTNDSSTTRHFYKRTTEAMHVMVAFGYRTAKFYRTENGVETLVRSDTYLHVTDGYGRIRYVIMDDTLAIDDGAALLIHND